MKAYEVRRAPGGPTSLFLWFTSVCSGNRTVGKSPALRAGRDGSSRARCRSSNAQYNHGSVQVLDSRWPIPAFAGYEQMGAVWRATSGPRPGVSRYSRLDEATKAPQPCCRATGLFRTAALRNLSAESNVLTKH
jgi:hypothetical protein